MICRAGGLTKQDIGAIRISDHETRFEVAAAVAEQFASDILRRSSENIRIEPLEDQPADAGAGGFAPRAKGPKKKHEARPMGKKERLAT